MSTVPDLPVEAQIADLERRWTAAFQRKDVAAMQRFLADGYALIISVEGNGSRSSRATPGLKAWRITRSKRRPSTRSMSASYGDVAVAVMLWRQKASLRGADRSAQFTLTDIWVKQANGWRLAERHSSRPEHPGSARPQANPLECELCE